MDTVALKPENKTQVGYLADRIQYSKSALFMLVLWFAIAMCWWLLAFWPPSESNSWIVRTQYVCFGKLPGQLLPASGWILLFGGPLLLLFSMVVVFGSDMKWSIKQILKQRVGLLSLIFLMLAFASEVIWVGYRIYEDKKQNVVGFSAIEGKSADLPDTILRTYTPVPKFQLVNQRGEVFTSEMMSGVPTFLVFVFAHCASVCPTLIHDVKSATQELGPSKVRSVFITLDPWRDRPSRLSEMAKDWELSESSQVLSGEVDQVVATHKLFNVVMERNKTDGDIVHPSLVFILDQQNRIAYTINGPTSRWLVEAAQKLIKE